MSEKRVKIALACEVCGERNYRTTRQRKADRQGRLMLKKYCRGCGRRTVHRETK